MPPLFKLIAVRLRTVGHQVTELRRGGALKTFVVLFFGVLLVGMLFEAMVFGFRFMRGYPEFKAVLVRYLFFIYFLTMLLMLTFSNAVISFGALFRSPETRLLLSLPLEPRTIYNYKAGESLLFSSWAFMVLGAPLLVAFGLFGGDDRMGPAFYWAAAALMIPFIFIPASLGAVLGLLLTRYFPRHRGKLLGLGFAILAAAGMLLTLRAGLLENRAVIDDAFLERLFATFAFSRSPLAPSYWISRGILAASRSQWSTAAFYWAMLASTALFLWMLGDLVAERIYAAGYSRSAGALARRIYLTGGPLDGATRKLARLAPITARLVAKDVRTFVRDPLQWSQILIFFGLLFLYVANLRNLGYERMVLHHIQNLRWTSFVSFANLAAAGLTLATLTTRFVFPLISIEGRRFWVLSLLPIRRSRLLLGKYLFSLGGSLLLIVPLVLLSAYMLGTPANLTRLHVLTALAMCLGLPGIAVGMGAIFPNYKEESPAKIVSGFGGTLCLVFSVAFVGLLVMGVGLLSWQHLRALENLPATRWPLEKAAALAVGSSIVASILPMWLGCRAINKAEL